MSKNQTCWCLLVLLISLFCCPSAFAQTTAFTYQGRLNDGGAAPTGNYDLQFTVWDASSAGNQLPTGSPVTIVRTGQSVTAGIFTVSLDFGGGVFTGADRFLEISVRHNSGEAFATLSPRQQISSTPYAVRSLNAATAESLIILGFPVMNVNGPYNDGTLVYAASNTSAGAGAGQQLTPDSAINSGSGKFNSFFGAGAGKATTSGSSNSFFGTTAGEKNVDGIANSFFGNSAGFGNSTGSNNSFFGVNAGKFNKSSGNNSFFGVNAGAFNDGGENNSFFGVSSGFLFHNTSGNDNTALGFSSLVIIDSNNQTAIGARAQVSQANSLVLGSISGTNGATADTNVGIGTTAPQARLHIKASNGNILFGNGGCAAGFAGLGFAATLTCSNYSLLGDGANTIINRPSGGAIAFRENNSDQMLILAGGIVQIFSLGAAGSTQLCRNNSNQVSTCSSSLRYKTNITPFSSGLSFIKQLRPITFDWKQNGAKDVGFGAEDVAKVNPLFITYNDKGEVEGVKYDRLSAAFVNAFKEQQAQIEELKREIRQLQARTPRRGKRH